MEKVGNVNKIIGGIIMKIKIQFLGGESRYKPGSAVNYMMPVDGIKEYNLYAEHIVTTKNELEGYDELKQEILEQAKLIGLHESQLIFN
jgi:hypothetical protein